MFLGPSTFFISLLRDQSQTGPVSVFLVSKCYGDFLLPRRLRQITELRRAQQDHFVGTDCSVQTTLVMGAFRHTELASSATNQLKTVLQTARGD